MTLSAACSATLCAPSLVTRLDVQGRAAFRRYSAPNTYSAREKPQSGASRLRFACKLGTTPETRRLPRINCLGGRMTCYAAKREVDPQEALQVCPSTQSNRAICGAPDLSHDLIPLKCTVKYPVIFLLSQAVAFICL
jgi:hypothetical protein